MKPSLTAAHVWVFFPLLCCSVDFSHHSRTSLSHPLGRALAGIGVFPMIKGIVTVSATKYLTSKSSIELLPYTFEFMSEN